LHIAARSAQMEPPIVLASAFVPVDGRVWMWVWLRIWAP